ncbi:MAG: OmpA family protein [Candidatus Kapabacteria bacterium]|nr:OmpA family protein [Ignavibacteriota bacterium]MCW5885708.1 OmpA family protein [Candidatus Kapabacteria bacterium]
MLKYIILMLFMGINLYSQSTIVSLTGSVKNYLTGEPLGIDIRVFNSEGKQVAISKSNSLDGYYFLTGLHPDSVYFIRFMDFAYLSDSHEFQVPNTTKYQEYSRDFLVKPKKVGLKFPLKVIPFDIGKSKLRSGVDYFLGDIANVMKMNRRVSFKIHAYPDKENNSAFNQELCSQRAESLKKYFIDKGVNVDRINIQGYDNVDPQNPPPKTKQAKGKRYTGSIYLEITGTN